MTLHTPLPTKRMCNVYDSIAVVLSCGGSVHDVLAQSLDLLSQLGDTDQLILVDHSGVEGMANSLAQLADLDSRVIPIIAMKPDAGVSFNAGLREVAAGYVIFLDGTTRIAHGGISLLRSAIHSCRSANAFLGIQGGLQEQKLREGRLCVSSLQHEVPLSAFMFKRIALQEAPFLTGYPGFHALALMAKTIAGDECQIIPGDFYTPPMKVVPPAFASLGECLAQVEEVFKGLPDRFKHKSRDFALDAIQHAILASVKNGFYAQARRMFFEVFCDSPFKALRPALLKAFFKTLI